MEIFDLEDLFNSAQLLSETDRNKIRTKYLNFKFPYIFSSDPLVIFLSKKLNKTIKPGDILKIKRKNKLYINKTYFYYREVK